MASSGRLAAAGEAAAGGDDEALSDEEEACDTRLERLDLPILLYFHSLLSSASAHALSEAAMKERPSMNECSLKARYSCVAIA